MPPFWPFTVFQPLPQLPTNKLGPSGADSQVGGLKHVQDPMSISNKLSCEAFLLLPQPPQVFVVRGFEALFPRAGNLGCMVCLAPQLFQFICMQMWDHLAHQPPPRSPIFQLLSSHVHHLCPRLSSLLFIPV